MKDKFTVTEPHLKLLRAANIGWNNAEFGAPGIDPKKPYSNSDVLHDIALVIGLKFFSDEDGEKHLSKEQAELCHNLHREIKTALQILTSNLRIEIGEYECGLHYNEWKKVA